MKTINNINKSVMKILFTLLILFTFAFSALTVAQIQRKDEPKKVQQTEQRQGRDDGINSFISFPEVKTQNQKQDNLFNKVFPQLPMNPDATVQIGSGSDFTYCLPVYSSIGYSYTQQIYLGSEIIAGGGSAGTITHISFYYSSGTWNVNSSGWTIYLGNTTKTSFAGSTDWVPVGSMSQVFSNTITTPVEGWNTISLTTPFNYTGGNLVVAVNENTPGGNSADCYWRDFLPGGTGGQRAIYAYDNWQNINPASPPAGILRYGINQIQLEISQSPFLFVTPSSIAFGYVPSGGISAEQTYILSGTNLTSSPITVNTNFILPFGFQVSTNSGTGFGPRVDISFTPPTLSNTTIYVRFIPTSQNTVYSGNIRNLGGGATTRNVAVTGSSYLYSRYCTSNATLSTDEDIGNVTLGTLNNTSTCGTTGGIGSIINKYSNYTTTVSAPDLQQSSSNPFSVSSITCGGNYSNAFKIFIDFNKDGDFADSGEEVYVSAASTSGPHTETGNILIPAGASLGNTMMRVINVETETPSGILACGTYSRGETEDYLVNITAAPSCLTPTAVTSSAVTSSTATISWTAPTPAPSNGYQWEVRTSGTPGSGGETASGSTGAGIVTADVTGLSTATIYSVYVRSYCGGSDYSSWTSAHTFTTSYELPFTESFNAAILPQSWTTSYSSGVNNLWSVSNSAVAGGSAYEMFLTFQNINPGTARLILPAINTTGKSGLTFSFKQFYDDFGEGVTMKIQTSTDKVTWTDETWSIVGGNGNQIGTVNTIIRNNLNSARTYIAFVATGNLLQYGSWYIDDVNVAVNSPMAGNYYIGLAMFNKNSGKNLYYEKRTRKVEKEIYNYIDEEQKIENKKNKQTQDRIFDNTISNKDERKYNIQKVSVEEEFYELMESGKTYKGSNYNHRSNSPDIGDYTTITAAINDLNLRGVSNDVTFILTDATYPSESYPLVINNVNGVSSSRTITIKPGSGVTPTITGSVANNPIFKIYGTNYVTIDGSNNGTTSRDMTISNTSSTFPSVVWIGSQGTTPIKNVTVKNCNIINGANTYSAVVISDGVTSGSAGYFNNIEIENNSVQNAFIGVYSIAVEESGNGSGLYYCCNSLNTSGANSIRLCGLYVQGVDGAMVIGNTVGNMANTADASDITGIWFATGTVNSSISENIINTMSGTSSAPRGIMISSDVTASNNTIVGNTVTGLTSSSTGSTIGINISFATGRIKIHKNNINNIKNTNSDGYSAIGISLNSSLTTLNTADVYNNIIYDVAGYGNISTTTNNGYGINILTGGGYNLYYNSINLATNQSSSTGNPACLIINSSVTTASTLNIRNNIFSIPATVGTQRYCVLSNAENTVFADINYNDYFSLGSIGYLSSERTTLTAWQTATGKDAYSLSADPGFTSNTNLQIDVNNPNCWNINGGAYPLQSVTTDINGTSRKTLVTQGPEDIGAYTFTPAVEPNAVTVGGSIGNEQISILSFAGKTIARITWHSGTGTLPSSISATFKPGAIPPGSLTGEYAYEYLDITPSGGTLPYTYDLTMYYNLARTYNIDIINQEVIKVCKYSSNAWTLLPDGFTNPSESSVFSSGIATGFSSFTFTNGNTPLPVKLSSFSSQMKNRDVVLNWVTENEINNSGFEIERKSLAAIEWNKVAFVEGRGNTNSPTTYKYEDKKLNSGKYNYRLKQIDLNGGFEYYNLANFVEVELPTKYDLSQNYPNPFNPVTKINFDLPKAGQVSLKVFDILGKEVKTLVNEIKDAGYYNITFDASGLPSGVYFYRISAGEFSSVKKLVLLK